MSTITSEAASTTNRRLAIRLFDHPDADIVLRSQDSYHIQVPKVYIVNSSPVLGELIQKVLDSPDNPDAEESLPVLQLPESGEILECLLTFVFPITPRVPSVLEEIMKLLSVAQKYQMGAALSHIRATIAQQNLLPTRLEPTLHLYALAQQYGLRPEAVQAVQSLLKYPMTIESFYNYNKLDIIPGAFLYSLWTRRKRVRAILASDLTEFMASRACSTIVGLCCTELSSSQIPSWLDRYINSIGKAPNLFDAAEFNIALARHTKDNANEQSCECAFIPSQTIRDFWEALASVVHGSFEKAVSASPQVVRKKMDPHQINLTTRPHEAFNVSDANLIVRSSDLVDFRVHKSVLAMVSPFFQDLLSLPQPSDSESVDGLPVVQLSESSELLNSLISLIYPIPTVVPNTYEKVLYLLAACHKYEMPSIRQLIRGGVNRKQFPAPIGTQAFPAYAIASEKGLLPEMKSAARSTLKYPMTFERLGKGLRFFKGQALCNLADFRKRCKDNMVTCLDAYLDVQHSGPSSVWVGCPEVMPCTPSLETRQRSRALPIWLNECLSQCRDHLTRELFTSPIELDDDRIWRMYVMGRRTHSRCQFCRDVEATKSFEYFVELDRKLRQAIDEVRRDRGSRFRLT